MKTVSPNLNFNGNAEEAFVFYKSVFGGEFSDVVRFEDMESMMGVPESEQHKIAHIALPLENGTRLMGSDMLDSFGKPLTMGNNFYITLEAENAGEAERLFNALADGGQVEMPLQKTEWAEKFGQCVDKFNIQWMVNYAGEDQS